MGAESSLREEQHAVDIGEREYSMDIVPHYPLNDGVACKVFNLSSVEN